MFFHYIFVTILLIVQAEIRKYNIRSSNSYVLVDMYSFFRSSFSQGKIHIEADMPANQPINFIVSFKSEKLWDNVLRATTCLDKTWGYPANTNLYHLEQYSNESEIIRISWDGIVLTGFDRFFYMAFSNCNFCTHVGCQGPVRMENVVMYLYATEDSYQHLSAADVAKYKLRMFLLITSIIFTIYSFFIIYLLRSRHKLHFFVYSFMVGLWLEFLNHMFGLIYYNTIKISGYNYPSIKLISKILTYLSESVLYMFFLLLANGFRIVHRKLKPKRRIKIAIIVSLYFALSLFFFLYLDFYAPIEQKSLSVYNSSAFLLFVLFRFIILVMFLFYANKIFKEYQSHLIFMKIIVLFATIYMAIPIITFFIIYKSTYYNVAFIEDLMTFIPNILIYLVLLLAFTPCDFHFKNLKLQFPYFSDDIIDSDKEVVVSEIKARIEKVLQYKCDVDFLLYQITKYDIPKVKDTFSILTENLRLNLPQSYDNSRTQYQTTEHNGFTQIDLNKK